MSLVFCWPVEAGDIVFLQVCTEMSSLLGKVGTHML